MNPVYFPRIKTTPAELRALSSLSPRRRKQVCPILELTRGIKEKIEVQANRIRTQVGDDTPFILDLTLDPTFQDSVIEGLLNNNRNGYQSWRRFLDEMNLGNIIPSLVGSLMHFDDLVRQIKFYEKYYDGRFAFRIPIGKEDDISVLKDILKELIFDNVNSSEEIYLLLDFKDIIGSTNAENMLLQLTEIKSTLKALNFQGYAMPLFSSYPEIPPPDNGRNGDCSYMPLEEFKLCDKINRIKGGFIHADYAFIHPRRNASSGVLWYPRIDYPTQDRCYWVRSKNKEQVKTPAGTKIITNYSNQQAYQEIAERIVHEDWYSSNRIECWGTEQIELAAGGSDDVGKSPQHWIAVRANIHMSRMVDYLTGYDLI